MINPTKIEKINKIAKDRKRFAKLKEVQANVQNQRFCASFNFTREYKFISLIGCSTAVPISALN